MLATVHLGLRYIWIEIPLFVRFVTMRVPPFSDMKRIQKWVYLTQYCFVVMGDGVMAAIEYVRSVPQECRPTE